MSKYDIITDRIEAPHFDWRIPKAVMSILLFLTFAGCAQKSSPNTNAFIDWASENSINLDSSDASFSNKSLKAFRESIGSARVVGIGESRHDTREQLLLKATLVQHLIKDLGFRTLIIEESYPHALALQEYVISGEGDLRMIVNGLAGWYLWDTEEMVELIEWIRRFNTDQLPDGRVHIFGMDITAPAPGVRSVLEFMELSDIGNGLNDQKYGLDLQEGDFWPTTWERYSTLSEDRQEQLTRNYNALVDEVNNEREVIISSSSQEKYEQIRRLAEVGRTGNEFFLSADRMVGGMIRENGMANIALWIMENEMPEEKTIIWAHNLHVATSTFTMPELMEGTLEPMGIRLKKELGSAYISIGAAFGSGSYSSDLPPGERSFDMETSETMDGALARAGHAEFLIDLRQAKNNPLVSSWLHEQRTWRAQDANSVLVPDLAFDMVYFVKHISRSQPTALALQRFQATRE